MNQMRTHIGNIGNHPHGIGSFFQSLLNDISNILENICYKYTKIKVPYKYRKVVKELSERKDISFLNTDKDG